MPPKVICVDIDETSCKVSRENAEINKVENRLDIRRESAGCVVDKADVIIANIIADVIISFSEDVMKFLEKMVYLFLQESLRTEGMRF